ncbi:MAG: acyl-CoA dehydrogenase family protein [Actinomycetota bacterium]|nr:acyl-CoA dehydrogenase family protein [Actinomycetota bacterium]
MTVAAPARSPSVAKSMFAGGLDGGWLMPFPVAGEDEMERVRDLIAVLREYCSAEVDGRALEEQGWIGDELVRCFAERGLMGLGIPREYGGQGLSMTGYCRMFEEFGRIDQAMALVLGIHQSIGTRGIVEFGTEEQKERLLPDLADGRRLAAFALTEPGNGSDAYNITSRAVRRPDGSWRLNGSKCFIGNGSTGSVFVTIARAEAGGRDRHVALILEKGMEGFEHGERYGTLGLRANDVRPLRFNDVRVPPENVLGEPGEGFRIAMRILENGRLAIAATNVGCAKFLSSRILEHVHSRHQFGRPLADFELVKEKLGWIAERLFAVECMTYLTAGVQDAGLPDRQLETAICKVTATDFVNDVANRALDLRGGMGYMHDEPYERILRDVRVFPIFEGANDVLRTWIAQKGMGAVMAALQRGDEPPGDPVPGELREVAGQARRLREVTQRLMMRHGEAVRARQLDQHRLAHSIAEIYQQAAVASRMAQLAEEEPDDERLGAARTIADAFRRRSARRVAAHLDAAEEGAADDDVAALAASVYEHGPHGHAFAAI